MLVSLSLLANSARQYAGLKTELESQSGSIAEVDVPDRADAVLPFPTYSERFDLTTRVLKALRIDESLPGKISFAYDSNTETGVVRQTATLNVASRWQEIGGLLDRAQSAIPTAYISRLQISRDTESDPELGAEVQLTLVYLDSRQEGVE